MKRRIVVTILFIFLLNFAVFSIPAQSAVTDCTLMGGTKCSITFSYTGSVQNWTVPSGVSTFTFDVVGAAGGAGTGSRGAGGKGGRDTGTVTISPNTLLYIFVGGQGASAQQSGNGGFNGGGGTNSLTSNYGGAGGGASDFRTSLDTSTRIVVAGGGGGASGFCNYSGGAGGGLTGANGTGWCYQSIAIGTGGTQANGGSNNFTSPPAAQTTKSGGIGFGGKGYGYNDGGGGGGGGYYGGGGGIVEAGGGGSSYVDVTKVSSYTLIQGDSTATGNGSITFIYTAPSPAVISISIPSGIVYRSSTNLTVNSDSPGKVTFYANRKKIPGCVSVTLSGSSPSYSAQCGYRASNRGNVFFYATISPSDSHVSASSNQVTSYISNRSNLR